MEWFMVSYIIENGTGSGIFGISPGEDHVQLM